jgi:two-component system probable response regulator PhcQ
MKDSVLMVDDEPGVLSALLRTLRMEFRDEVYLETCADPVRAVQRLKERAFDVVMSDFRMPAMTGIEFLRKVSELQPNAMRIIVSASVDAQTVMNVVNQVGVFRYIVKPWQGEELIAGVRQALAQAHVQREQRKLADAMRVQRGEISRGDAEMRRLEELAPGITRVEWGPNGEVLMPPLE